MSAIDKARVTMHGSLAWGAFTQAEKSLGTPAGQAQAHFVQEQAKAFTDTLSSTHDCGMKTLARQLNTDTYKLTPADRQGIAQVATDFRELAAAAHQVGLPLEPRNPEPSQ